MFGLFVLCLTVSQTFGVRSKNFETRDQTVKNTSMFMATAGLTHHLIDVFKLKIDSTTLPGQLQKNSIKGVVGIGLNMAIKGEELHEALEQGVKEVAFGTLSCYASSKIALKYGLTDKTCDALIHKGLHGVVGAFGGLALGNSKEAMIAGGIGAMSAEIAFDTMVSKEDINKKTLEIARTAKTRDEFDKKLFSSFQRQRDIAKIIGATSGAFFGQEPSIAQQTASTAIDNNASVAVQTIARLALNRMIAEGGKYIAREFLNEINKLNLNETQKEAANKKERKGPELEPNDPKKEAQHEKARRLGQEGEQRVRESYNIGEKKEIKVPDKGNSRFPDGINKPENRISEVKNVNKQGLTKQLKDYQKFAENEKMKFDLYVRPDTKLSKPLQAQIDKGSIIKKFIPEPKS